MCQMMRDRIVHVTATWSDSQQDSKTRCIELSRLGLSLQVRLQHLVQLTVVESRGKRKISRCIDRRLNLPS